MSVSKIRFFKIVSVFLAINLLAEVIFPTAAYALTSGPKQPEFSSFEPVATTDMVHEFSGAFTYNLPVVNIPGPNGGGYALSLSYHSGTSPEEDASWVGYGWTLNPGAINRGKQGFPDDYKNEPVISKNRVPKNWTASVGLRGGLELFSVDNAGLSASAAVRYNSYKGFGTVYGIGASIHDGLASVNYSVSGEEGHSFTADINPAALLNSKKRKAAKEARKLFCEANQDHKQRGTVITMTLNEAFRKDYYAAMGKKNSVGSKIIGSAASAYGMHSLADDYRPTHVPEYTSSSVNVSLNIGADPICVHLGVEGGLYGNYTEQVGKASSINSAYGFLYQPDALASADAGTRMMDYHVEKESMFNKRDRYLSIPYQSADQFSVTGEGLGGGFRLHSRHIGHFYPREASSVTSIINEGFDFTLGLDIEPFTGFNIGVGHHTLEVRNWNHTGNSTDYAFTDTGDEPYFFRFNNDKGGNVVFSQSDEAYKTSIFNLSNVPGARTYKPMLDENAISPSLEARSGRSSYIDYNTNSRMYNEKIFNSSLNRDIYYRAHTRDNPALSDDAWDLVDRSWTGIGDRIGEIATYNEGGNKYVYGLPVFSADERNMSYSVRDHGSPQPALVSNYLAYKDVSNDRSDSEVGEIRTAPYATSYLLTEITTPEYLDRTLDGPTNDDFGGWTRFNYRNGRQYMYGAQYGGPDKSNRSNWYKWRFPYNGLYYDRGELCDPRDDMGSMSSGVKEIYYLKSIETKTHIAYFITNLTNLTVDHESGPVTLMGSGESRKDGLSAADNDMADNDQNVQGTPLEYLERIEVYAKNENNELTGKPLKTVHLAYSYELCPNLVNNVSHSADGTVNPSSGKLTLKKVWFEYEGIVNAKIAPYEFGYQYKLQNEITSPVLLAKYNHDTEPGNDIIGYGNGLNENPAYDAAAIDVWGNLGYNGTARRELMQPWLYQGAYPQGTTFDPAAWQLKRIKLPSGGEINIQYEQNDYAYVQDEVALGMISLTNQAGNNTGAKDEVTSDNKYYLNLSDADLDENNDGTVDATEKQDFVDKCSGYLSGHKIHFRFLYRLIGDDNPTITGCGSEYITGYTSADIGQDPNGIFISMTNDDPKGYAFPRQVCRDYLTRNKAGLNLDEDCDVARDAMGAGDPIEAVKGLKNRLGTDFSANIQNCKRISLRHSYFRLPLLKAKRGGGVRVKRLLMYDAGLEPGDEVLYGTEYIYKNADGTSSGVAANEPQGIREENSLVTFLDKRATQTIAQRIIAGNDQEQFEGPLGESLLPPPSVGYERIITRNIHSGKSGTGYKVSEYYTLKDRRFAFSTAMRHTPVDEHAKDFLYVPAIWVNMQVDNRWVSQGYSFVLNNMHGQLRRVAMYGGEYTGTEDNNFKSFEEVYEYYDPGAKVPVLDETGNISLQHVGKEMEVAMEMRSVEDIQNDASLQVDFSVGIALFIPIFNFSVFPYYSFNEKKLRTHVINKVVRYPAILKSVTTTRDGIVHISENRVFNKATGSPVVTVSYDGYDKLDLPQDAGHKGTYTNYTIPASLVYKHLGQKAKNAGYQTTYDLALNLNAEDVPGRYGFTLRNGSIINGGLLVEGDLIKLTDNSGNRGIYYISGFTGSTVHVQALLSASPISAFTALEVINSGYRNTLNLEAGKISTYGADYSGPSALPASPLVVSGGSVSLANLPGVLSASAQTYKDTWGNSYMNAAYNLPAEAGDFETGRRGKWRAYADFVYKTSVTDAVSGTNRIHNAGMFEAFTGFNYTDSTANDAGKWLRANRVTAYSPDGNVLEEENILGVKSAARFGYRESVPVLIAHNAPYNSASFHSYEDEPGATDAWAHSGYSSRSLSAATLYTSDTVVLDDQIRNYGLGVKFWLRTEGEFDLNDLSLSLKNTVAEKAGEVKQIARVGEWTLIEARFKGVFGGLVNGSRLGLNILNNSPMQIWLDDLRVLPLDGQMVCYVYDRKNLRLLTSFDDQHFGLYYQYNAEGQLVRKLAETERGIKTIAETQYNVPLTQPR